jgi:serine/threonine protein kinase
MATISTVLGVLPRSDDYKIFIPEILEEIASSAYDSREYLKAMPSFQRVLGRYAEPIARAYFIDHSPEHLSGALAKQVHVVNQLWFYVFPHIFCGGSERVGWCGVSVPSLEGFVVLQDKLKTGCSVVKEYSLLSELPKHEGIVEALAMETNSSGTYLYLKQYSMDSYAAMYEHSLFNKIEMVSHDAFVEKNIKTVACQLISGLAFLHDNHIIHGDIKPENSLVLVNPANSQEIIKAVWADFSFSCKWENTVARQLAAGSRTYVSPELANVICLLEKEEQADVEKLVRVNNYAKDIWALGISFTVLFRSNLEPGFLNKITNVCFTLPNDIMDKIASLATDPKQKNEWVTTLPVPPNSVESFIQGFLQIDPTRRITLHQALAKVNDLQLASKF